MGQQETVAGSALRRMILLVALAAVVAAMTVATAPGPAAAKNSNQDQQEPHEPGPPALSGKGFDGTIVAHCKAIDGSDSSLVINIPKENISGGGECNPFPQP
jgi:hypothetical protein